jgi:hypothetical protein
MTKLETLDGPLKLHAWFQLHQHLGYVPIFSHLMGLYRQIGLEQLATDHQCKGL